MPPKGKKGRQNDWEDEMGEDLTKKDEPTPPADDEPAAAMKGKPKKQGKKKGGAFDDAFDDADDAGAEGRADEDKEVAPAKGDEKGAGAKKGAAGKKAGKKGAFDDALDDDDAAEPAQSAAPAKGGGKGGKKGKGKRFDGSDEDEPAPLVAAPEPVAEAAAPKAKAAAKKAAKKGKGGKGRFDDSDDDDDAPSVAPPEPTAEAAAPKAKAAAKKAAKKGKGGKGRFDESDDDDDAPLPPASAAGGDDDDDESDEEAAVAEPVGKGKSMPKGGFSAVLDTEDLPSDDDDDEPPAPAPARPLASAARGSADGAEPSSASAASEVALPSAPGPIVVRVVACAKHPAADRLAVCQLDSGDASAPVQVVCGGANARPGILAVLIPAGGSVPASGAPIEACAVRGVESAGMLCSAAELNVEPALSGHIVELDHESAAARSLGAGFDSDWLMPWPPLDLSEGKPAFSDLWARIFDAAESVEVLGLTLSAPPPAAPDATPFQIAPKRAAADADAPVVEKKKKKGLFSKLADEPAAAGGVADAAADAADGLALGAQKPSAGKLAALGAAADATAVDARAADATAADEGLGFGGKKKKKAVAADAEPAAAEVAPPPAAPVAAAAESVGFGKKQKGSAGGKVTDAEESVGFGFKKKGSAGGKASGGKAAEPSGKSAAEAAADAELEAELAAELAAPIEATAAVGASADADADAFADAGESERPGWMSFVGDGAKGGKKGKKARGKKGAADEAEDEDALLDAMLAEKRAAEAEAAKLEGGADAGADGGADEDGDDDGKAGGLTKAQKKKLKAKAQKEKKAAGGAADADEGASAAAKEDGAKDKKGKPVSAAVRAMREAQERRRLVERIEEDILMLREDAKALLKQLDSLNLGDRALHRVDPAEADREIREMGAKCDALVEEVRARTESGELADVRFDSLGPVAEVVANIQASMADWLVRDEKRRKAKDKERAKREEQRAQGLLLSKTDKERKARDDAFRAQLAARGALPKDGAAADGAAADADAAAAQAEGGARKRVVYGNRKKGGGGGGGGGAKPDAGADADAPKPATALERAAARAEGGGGADDDGDDDDGSASDGSASHEDDWEAVDVDALRLGKKPDAEAAAEEDARKRAAALSSKLDGIAASAAKAEAERAKADKLDKLFNFKAPAPKGGKHESDDDDDESGSGSGSDSDSDSESGSESESESDSEEEGEGGLAGQRKEAERLARLDGARAARLARVARSMKARSADDLRSPIVCIMGHVDTGKTKLLDKIRRTNVQAGEAGGITQQIGASFFPADTLRKQTEALQKVAPYEVRVPGLLIIDTPGHESFSNLRSRGSSLCDIAILVIDIMHGLEPQTIESLRMLVEKQTPFVVALNKVDRLYDWKEKPWAPFRESLAAQAEHVRNEFADRAAQAKLALAEQGVNSELYWDNELYWTDPAYRDYICIVPTSAITGEGIPDLLQLLVNMNQRQQYMLQRIMWSSEPQATVLEVKVVEGLGHTVDIILANGSLKQGDTIVLCGFNGPIVTTVRALLTPQPLKEIRIKADYIHHTEIRGAQGIKIAANNLDKVVAGGSLLVLHNPKDEDELEVLKEEVMVDLAKLAKAVSDLSDGDGVYAMASTLGSLEALLEFLRTSKIPVHAINIGPVHKLDVIRASTQLDRHNPEYATILAFDVPVTKDAEKHADDVGVKIFTANIIYHLFDHFTKYMAEVKVKNQEAARLIAAFPVITAIIPEFIFNRGGPGDPFVAGMTVKEGILRRGTPLCVVNPAPAGSTDGPVIVELGRVASIEKDKKAVDELRKGQSGAVKVETPNNVTFGRHFTAQSAVYSRLTRESINALKEHFKDDLSKEDWQLVIKLKRMFAII